MPDNPMDFPEDNPHDTEPREKTNGPANPYVDKRGWQEDGSHLICLHCKKPKALANPSGFCSHVHWPEDCPICLAANPTETDILRAKLSALISENEALKKTGAKQVDGVWLYPFYNADGSEILLPFDKWVAARKLAGAKAALADSAKVIFKRLELAAPRLAGIDFEFLDWLDEYDALAQQTKGE